MVTCAATKRTKMFLLIYLTTFFNCLLLQSAAQQVQRSNVNCPSMCTCTYLPENEDVKIKVVCEKINSLSSVISIIAASNNNISIVHLEVSGSSLPRLNQNNFHYNILTSLERLVLKNDKIEHISDNCFSNLTRLKLLDLSNNKLTTLGPAVWDQLVSLERLRIAGNPIRCDCDLISSLKTRKVRNLKIQGQCFEPPLFRDKPIAQVRLETLSCENDIPTIEMKPLNNQIVFQGDPIRLSCKMTTKNRSLHLLWTFNNTTIANMTDVSIVEAKDDSNNNVQESFLQILKLEMTHSGLWTCAAVFSDSISNTVANRSVEVTVLSLVTPSCSNDITVSNKGHYAWPRTMGGLKISLPCQSNINSQASRWCNTNGTWEDADTSACFYVSEVTKVLEQFSKTNLTFSKTSALESAKRLSSYLDDVSVLEDPQDVVFVSETLQNYLEAAVKHQELLPIIMDVVSYLLRQPSPVLEPSRSAISELLQDVPSKTQSFQYQSNSISVEKIILPSGNGESENVTCNWSSVTQNATSKVNSLRNRLQLNCSNLMGFPFDEKVEASVQVPVLESKSQNTLILSLLINKNLFSPANSSSILVSPVISVGDTNAVDRTQPLLVKLPLKEALENVNDVKGAEWDYFRQQWLPSCTVREISKRAVTFTCCCGPGIFAAVHTKRDNSITSSALDLSLGKMFLLPSPVYVGSVVCVVCHIVAVVCYVSRFGKLQMTRPTKHSLINTWISLSLLVSVYTVGVKPCFARRYCQAVGLSLHYLTLSTLLWLMVGASGLYKHLNKARKREPISDSSSLAEENDGEAPAKPALRFYLIGWGIPFIVVGIAGAIHIEQYASSNVCFLAKTPSFGAVGLPAAILVFLILTFHLLTWCFLRHLSFLRKQLQVTATFVADETSNLAESKENASLAPTDNELRICVSQQNKNRYLPLLGDNGSCPSNLTNLTHLTQGTEMTDLTSVSETQEPEGLSLLMQNCERGEAEGAVGSSNEGASARSDIERPLLMITPCSDDRIAETAKSVDAEGHTNPLMNSFTDDNEPPEQETQTAQLLQSSANLAEVAVCVANDSALQQFVCLPEIENADEKEPIAQLRNQFTSLMLFVVVWSAGVCVVVRPLKDVLPYDELLTSLCYTLVSASLGLHTLVAHCLTRKDVRGISRSSNQTEQAEASPEANCNEPPALLLTYASPLPQNQAETTNELLETSNCDVSLPKTEIADPADLNVTVEPAAVVNSFYDARQSKTARRFFQKQKMLNQTQNNHLNDTHRERGESYNLNVINNPQSGSSNCEETLRNVSGSAKSKVSNVNIHVDLGSYDWHELQNLVSNSETSFSKSEKRLPKVDNSSNQGQAPANPSNTATVRSDKSKRKKHHSSQRRKSKRSKWDEQFADKQPSDKPAYAFVNYDYREKALAQVKCDEEVLRTLTAVKVRLKEDFDEADDAVFKKETSV